MVERRTQRRYAISVLGFPITLFDVPMVKTEDEWAPDTTFEDLKELMAVRLALKPARLTGSEVRFLRAHFEHTLEEFSALFDYSYQAVMNWEAAGNEPTRMRWPVEKMLRLLILSRKEVSPSQFRSAYTRLEDIPKAERWTWKIPWGEVEEGPKKIIQALLDAA